ncbi:tigger transposable element-derived protein 4-like [Ornithodoros turicata]|uniref:tigger transposable element-derived protein 4-like n=1 Tax=Ornithodoros turicata TaxID=34597 RepID=UPI0031390B21
MPKRKLVELTLERKKEVLDKLYGGATCRQVAEEFKISKLTVSKIGTSRDEILCAWEQNSSSKRKRIIRKTDNESVNEKVLHFFFDCRSKNIPVSGPMLQEAALAAARSEGLHEFKASNGWLARFRERHAIECKSLSGEAAEIDTRAAEEWLKRVPDVTRGYEAKDIFNADGTALFYRQIPKRSLVTKVDAAYPRVFRQRKIQPSNLPVHWFFNRKAWMTSVIFNEWLAVVNKQMRWEGRRILIIVDNAPSHIMTKNLPNVEVKFLPPNLTSAVQPLDQGIIQTVKLHYRKLLLSSLV